MLLICPLFSIARVKARGTTDIEKLSFAILVIARSTLLMVTEFPLMTFLSTLPCVVTWHYMVPFLCCMEDTSFALLTRLAMTRLLNSLPIGRVCLRPMLSLRCNMLSEASCYALPTMLMAKCCWLKLMIAR